MNVSRALDLVRRGDWTELSFRAKRRWNRCIMPGSAATYWDRMHCGDHPNQEELSWWAVPGMTQRWNSMISGRPDMDYFQYVCARYLVVRRPLRALTLGCGTGHREREWAKYYTFERHDGLDISPKSVREAEAQAAKAGLSQCHYLVADLNEVELPKEAYDVVIAEQSLHHVAKLEYLCEQVKLALTSGGIFIVNEFVGPSRFQWTDRQLAAINAVLALLPESHRRSRLVPDEIKRSVARPLLRDLIRSDPSEVVRSSEISSVLRSFFSIVEWKGYGGALLHMLFENISGNFADGRSTDLALIQMCFSIEDALMETRQLPHDFILAVCERS
jgi:ubiquinone/menaquinone biosynthesis C-methylase UbiE